jgi:hypothetical protein
MYIHVKKGYLVSEQRSDGDGIRTPELSHLPITILACCADFNVDEVEIRKVQLSDSLSKDSVRYVDPHLHHSQPDL